jgi:hypothetical protein
MNPSNSRLAAIRHFLRHESHFEQLVLPHFDFEHLRIDWRAISRNEASPAHANALLLAKALWCDKAKPVKNPFLIGSHLDHHARHAALQAIAIYWGLIDSQFRIL